MKHVLPKENDLRMSSMLVAELCDKRHDNVLRDIESLIVDLQEVIDSSHVSSEIFEVKTRKVRGKEYRFIDMNEDAALLLVSGYNVRLRRMIIQEWKMYRTAFHNHTWRSDDKEVQKRVMATLAATLEEYVPLDFIKANTIVNKAVSNLYGFDKMVKKDEMSRPMLDSRQQILEDFERLFQVIHDYGTIKDVLYKKYAQLTLPEAA